MVLTLLATSNADPPFINIPHFAPTPVPTITAVGVANPKAHGHEMTKHEIANMILNVIESSFNSSIYHCVGTTFNLHKVYLRNIKKFQQNM